MSDFGNDDLLPHFIYCGNQYYDDNLGFESPFGSTIFQPFGSTILNAMKCHGILSSLLTMLRMTREHLITTETVKKAYVEGKIFHWDDPVVSLNDDLENLLIEIENQNLEEFKISEEKRRGEKFEIFFTPKLTNDELELVQRKDKEHFKTYSYYENPDVNIEEMKRSNSNSKYLFVYCERITVSLEIEHTAENKPTKPAYQISYTDDDSLTYNVYFYTDPIHTDRTEDIDHASPNLSHREFIRLLVDSYDLMLYNSNRIHHLYNFRLDNFNPLVWNFAPLPDHEYFRLLRTRNLKYVEYSLTFFKKSWSNGGSPIKGNICSIVIRECFRCHDPSNCLCKFYE